MSILFFYRGFSQERLSDKLLGWVMFLMAQEVQDYTFGFAGINFLWNEMNGFPRGVALLFGPSIYLYLRSQVNRGFHLKRQHLWHILPWAVFFAHGIFYFAQGTYAVQEYQQSELSTYLGYAHTLILWSSYTYYFILSLKLYKSYRKWSMHQFSDIDTIAFSWFRNFVYLMIIWVACKVVMNFLDWIFDWDFYQDWWWNLVLVGVSTYVGLAGYAQKQPSKISFESADAKTPASIEPLPIPVVTEQIDPSKEKTELAKKLQTLMEAERFYLQPEINLNELAQHLKSNASLLSATINQRMGQNFNDYINGLRVEEFVKNCQKEENKAYTLLSVAYESGFNSKATFNRAFKKHKGKSPKEYFSQTTS